MYQLIVILKALTEIAGVALLGQGILWVIAGSKRQQNIVYQMFQTLTRPVMKLTRWVTPRVVLDQHLGLVAFFLVAVLWLLFTILKIQMVLDASR